MNKTIKKYPIPELYIGVAMALIVSGVIWMIRDAILIDTFGRTSTLVFLAGMLMLFLPITIGLTAEYIQNRGKRKEEQDGKQ